MRRGSRIAGVVALVVTTALLFPAGVTPAGAKAAAVTEYPVGRVQTTFVDSSRPTAKNRTYAGAPDRTLPMLIMYPAKGGTVGALSTLDAKPDRSGGPYPLIAFSHGYTASGPAYGEVLLRRIAAQGYVVAAPTFPLTNNVAPGGPTAADYVHQPQDVSFVIDKMLAMNKRKGALHGLIDAKEIGAMGHSLGGMTTLGVTYNSAHRDKRIKAAVPMSGRKLPFPGGSWTWPSVPLLLVHGDKDGTVPYSGSKTAYAEAKAPKFLLTMLGAPHVFFGAPYLDQEVREIGYFFDAYLRHDKHALKQLERTGNVPGVSSLESDPG